MYFLCAFTAVNVNALAVSLITIFQIIRYICHMGIDNFVTFALTAFLFIMTPGMDTLFVINKAIGQGKKAGIYSALGVNAGVLFHTVLAALGLSLIVAKSVLAFAIVKYLGAAYLIYLGVNKIISKNNGIVLTAVDKADKSNMQNFLSGVVTNVLNPKVALFFLAFFPQFIKKEALSQSLPFIILGLTYVFLGLIWYLLLSVFVSFFSEKFISNPKAGNYLNKFSGVAFVLMGLKVAFSKK